MRSSLSRPESERRQAAALRNGVASDAEELSSAHSFGFRERIAITETPFAVQELLTEDRSSIGNAGRRDHPKGGLSLPVEEQHSADLRALTMA